MSVIVGAVCVYTTLAYAYVTYVIQIQAIARMWRARKAYRERLQFFGEHVSLRERERERERNGLWM